jgi:Flp pilus assembly protein TadD
MLQYAAAALQNGSAPEAERVTREVLARHRNDARALELLGLALMEQGRPAEAVQPLEQSVRVRRDAANQTYLAIALLAIGQSPKAQTLLQRATERQPPFPPAFFELGKLLQQESRLPEAEAVFKRGMEAAPGIAEFPLRLGTILLERGEMEGAKHAFTRALAIAPGLPAALQGLVYSLRDTGDFPAATEWARKAFTRDPSDTKAQLLLATCLLELGKSEEATQHLRTLVAASPEMFGKALKAFTDVGRGRLWLKPSAAGAFLGLKKSAQA